MAEFLKVTDTRTNREYMIPVQDNVVQGQDLAQIKCSTKDDGAPETLRVFDPGFTNTAIMHSSVARGNGKASKLEFRGHCIYDLAKDRDFEDTAFLLIWNRFPDHAEKVNFRNTLAVNALKLPSHVKDVVHSFPKSAPYMTIMIGALSAALAGNAHLMPAVAGSHQYSSNMEYTDETILEVIGIYSACLGLVYSYKADTKPGKAEVGKPYVYNVFKMMGLVDSETGEPNPTVLSVFERWWIVSADHELAHSTCATLLAGSAQADPLSCIISGITSGYGILHLGAAENAYREVSSIGSPENVKVAVDETKAGKRRLMGVGHRVYKSKNDPRLVIVKELLGKLQAIGKEDPLYAVSLEMERQVNGDPFFARKGLYINFDLYWIYLYTSLGIDVNAVVPFFFASRVCGLMAHWRELMTQKTKLWRPNMVYHRPNIDEQESSSTNSVREAVLNKTDVAKVTITPSASDAAGKSKAKKSTVLPLLPEVKPPYLVTGVH